MPSLPRELRDIARALIDTATAKDELKATLGDLRTVTDALTSERAILTSLTETAIPLATRQQALTKALKGIHPFVLNTLLILQSRDLLHHLSAFLQSVLTMTERSGTYAEATMTTATELTATERKDLEKSLAKKFPGAISLRETVDPTILGGLIVDIGGKRIDASVKGKITRLKQIITS